MGRLDAVRRILVRLAGRRNQRGPGAWRPELFPDWNRRRDTVGTLLIGCKLRVAGTCLAVCSDRNGAMPARRSTREAGTGLCRLDYPSRAVSGLPFVSGRRPGTGEGCSRSRVWARCSTSRAIRTPVGCLSAN